ncbi:uncharacterized protein [Anoplolepis gracilipes]|uniref:uncharacterized protein n=1 Tax=Anoplolepis gracilipes TaxID=354296 RepID=UPI003BA2DF93
MSRNTYLHYRQCSERIIGISYSHYLDPMEGERWKNDIAYAMTPFKLIAWPIGVWPLQDYNFYSLLRSALGTCGAGLMVILPSIELYMGCTDAEQNVDCVMLICCGTLGVLKMIWFRIYANNLTDNYSSALNDYLTIENEEERAIMRKHAFIGRIVSCPMLCFSYISCIIYGLIPLLGYDKRNQINVTNEDVILEYAIPSACTMKYFNAPASMYKVLCLMQVIAMILSTNAHVGNDALFLNITLHICGQVKILRAHFIKFNVKSPRVYARFNALIQRHCYLIMLTRKLTNMISFVLLVELFIISILLCIMGFQFILALQSNDTVMMTKSLMIQSAFLTQLTVYSLIGSYLKSQMEDIRFSIYQSTWYNLPAKLMRNLIFIFMQAEYPVTLQAGNFITINLSTYMTHHRLLVSVRVIISTMASERWKRDIVYAMTPYKLMVWPIGVWPLQVYNFYSLLRSVLGICGTGLAVILPICELSMGCTNAEQNVDCLMFICCGTLGILKIISFRIYANNLTNNYNSALRDYLTIKNTEERAIMRKHAFIGRIIFCPLMCFSYFSCTMYMLNALMAYDEKNRNITNEDIILEFPVPSRCTLEYIHAPTSMYKLLVVLETFSLVIMSNANAGNDALFLNITLHVCGQVKILRTHFTDFDITLPRVHERFNALIQRHIYLIRMARELANMINFVLLIQLFFISILLCIMGFQFLIALKVKDTGMMTQSLMVQSAFLTQLMMYSFIGHYLKSQMEEIALSIYQTTWYEFPAKITKNLLFILMQSDSPVSFQAGNFITVNLSTLVSILKTSFSYLSVLRIMLET